MHIFCIRLHSAIASIITLQHPLANHGLSGEFYSVFTGEKHLGGDQRSNNCPTFQQFCGRPVSAGGLLKVLAQNLQEGGNEIKAPPIIVWVFVYRA